MSDLPPRPQIRKAIRVLQDIAQDAKAIRMLLEEDRDAAVQPGDEYVQIRGADASRVDDQTAKLLIRLGWTPPAGDQ